MNSQIDKLNNIVDQKQPVAGLSQSKVSDDGDAMTANPATAPSSGAAPAAPPAEAVKPKRVLHIVPHSHTDDLTSNKDYQKRLSQQSLA